MSNEDWKLGGDLGRIVGLGLAAVVAGWLFAPGMCDRPINIDPLACLLDADSGDGCD